VETYSLVPSYNQPSFLRETDDAELSVSGGLSFYVCKPIDSTIQIPQTVVLPRKRPVPKIELQQSLLQPGKLGLRARIWERTLRAWIAVSVSARVSRSAWRVGMAGRAASSAGSESGGTWLFCTEWTRDDEDKALSVEGSEESRGRDVIARRGQSTSSAKTGW